MSDAWRIDRRTLPNSVAALGLDVILPSTGGSPSAIPSRLTPDEFRRRLRGPIVTLPTAFSADFQVDHKAVRTMVRRALSHGLRIFQLTAGDAQFSSLSYEEIRELTRTAAEAVGDQGMLIAGTDAWWTERVIDFARFSESVRAAALLVFPPAVSDDERFSHYQNIARNTRLPLALHGHHSMGLVERLMRIDSIVAMKHDVSMDYYVDCILRFGVDRMNFYAGGSGEWFLVAQPYGAVAYFDNYASFAPEISERFWKAVQANDTATEVEIIKKYDHPFIYHPQVRSFWNATLEHFGVAKRFMRPPVHTYTDEEMEEVKAFYDERALYSRR